MSFTDKELPYKVIELSLTAARADVAQSLENTSNTMTIITLDGGDLTFKLNSTDNDSITASDGLKIEGTVITEIFWSNAAQPGLTAEIFLSWVD